MRGRVVAFALVLSVGMSPVLGAICAFDCDAPRARHPEPACHAAPSSTEDARVRDGSHGCGHQHGRDLPAFVSGSAARDAGVLPLAALTARPAGALVSDPDVSIRPSIGRPGSSLGATPLGTVLRI